MPASEAKPARRPCPMLRDKQNSMSGPGVSARASAAPAKSRRVEAATGSMANSAAKSGSEYRRLRWHGNRRQRMAAPLLSELLHGAEKSTLPVENRHEVERFASRLEVLPFDEAAAHSAEIRAALERRGL